MRPRFLADLVLLLAMLFVPWWLWVPLAVAGILLINDFFEVIVVALAYDLTYLAHGDGFWRAFPTTLGLLGLLIVVEFGRKYLFVK